MNGVGYNSYGGFAPNGYRSLKSTRRVEGNAILNDYRNRNQTNRTPFTSIQPQPNNINGKQLLENTRKRVQDNLRKRGYNIGGQKVPFVKKPKAYASNEQKENQQHVYNISEQLQKIQKSQTKPDPVINIKELIKPPILAAKEANTSKASKNHSSWSTNYSSDFKNWQALRKQLNEKPPTQIVPPKADPKIPIEERVPCMPVDVIGPAKKLDKRRVMEEKKKEQAKNVEHAPSETVMPPVDSKNKQEKLIGSRFKRNEYTTTNQSTFQMWPKSAFQTVASRKFERPIWSRSTEPTSCHFVKPKHDEPRLPAHKVLPKTAPYNVSLSINGRNSFGTKFEAKPRKHNAFVTEYQRSFHS